MCTVCGHLSVFLLTAGLDTIRNHAVCIRCRSSARNRHVAQWVIRETAGAGIRGLADFRGKPHLVVLNASSTGAIARALGKSSNITCFEFFEDVEPGALKDGVMNQDLRRMTFANDSVDLLVTEDVLEHVPEYRVAFAEIHRVLKRGGLHVYSIPFYFDRKTEDLFTTQEGHPVLKEPIEYHGDPRRGRIPCFAHFGFDLLEVQRDLGFDVKIARASYSDVRRFGVFDCYTLIARKR